MPGSESDGDGDSADDALRRDGPTGRDYRGLDSPQPPEPLDVSEGAGEEDGLARPRAVTIHWTPRLHTLMIATLSTSAACFVMIVASRSWGVGQWQERNMSAGAWAVCFRSVGRNGAGGESKCVTWNDFCPPASGRAAAAGAFTSVALVIAFAMLALQIREMLRPGGLAWFTSVQTALNHCLWLTVLTAWSLWAALVALDCGSTEFDARPYEARDHLWYGWGWMFLVWQWLVHMFTAFVISMKLAGLQRWVPCGL
eukprot:TRINITY_DN9849_c1_g3_i1.p1 TRINITY_DN9849_c1_g3~~TRINITY_DN9849_c1_g3_i1.p1  ORF type:complete len:276 (+),score=73.35 TRINITY_DN9849_c1_g3_i1:66-830(+)